MQDLPFNEVILFAYAADRTPRPTYVCLPSGLYHARTGRVLPQTGSSKKSHLCQAFTSLMGGVRSQHWTSQSTCRAPRRHQHTAAEQQCIPRGERSQLDLLRRRRGTHLPLRPRTNRKMDPALARPYWAPSPFKQRNLRGGLRGTLRGGLRGGARYPWWKAA